MLPKYSNASVFLFNNSKKGEKKEEKLRLTYILLARRDRPPAAPRGTESAELWEKVKLKILAGKVGTLCLHISYLLPLL